MTAKETEGALSRRCMTSARDLDEDKHMASDNYQDTLTDLKDSISGLKTRVMTDSCLGMTTVMS